MGRLNKMLYNYVFFTTFPVIIIIQNLSFYFFPFLVSELYRKRNLLFKNMNRVDLFAIMFAIGAILSVLMSLLSPVENSFTKGIAVLPNYLYWIFLVLLFSFNAIQLDYKVIYKAAFWGVTISTIYFYTISEALGNASAFFIGLQQNMYSFILICFAPMLVFYVQEKWGQSRAVIASILVVLAGTLSGSRSGSILTILTCFLTLYSNRLNILRIGLIAALLFTGYLSMNLPVVKDTVFQLNERTYSLIYETETTLAEDESYLVRLAQVEKGLGLFSENPFFGIGLNNFNSRSYNIEGKFEGFERLTGVDNLDQLSSHNSYINVLAEGGLFLFIPFVGLLLSFFLYFITKFKSIPDFQKPFFWGLLGMAIHFYFIFALVNVFAWLLMALVASAIKYNSQK
ncbi:MAG: O-antigen ligase family protein [Bacteroidetes bacterium]|nr:MAG: O-antigen ligase family protein [Bacteroidota bacterium]